MVVDIMRKSANHRSSIVSDLPLRVPRGSAGLYFAEIYDSFRLHRPRRQRLTGGKNTMTSSRRRVLGLRPITAGGIFTLAIGVE